MLKKIKEKKKITLKNSTRILLKFFKIVLFQYVIFLFYSALFLTPLFFLEDELFIKLNVYFLVFIAIFPMIQSLFHIHYSETGSLFSRFEVWIGSIFFFLLVPVVILVVL